MKEEYVKIRENKRNSNEFIPKHVEKFGILMGVTAKVVWNSIRVQPFLAGIPMGLLKERKTSSTGV